MHWHKQFGGVQREVSKNHGFFPEMVITDRSPLYPKTIAEVWPKAKQQLCVFHAMAEIIKHVLDAVREERRRIKPKRIKKGRGRPSKRSRARVRKLKEQREQADKLFRRRHLIVTKRSNIDLEDSQVLEELLDLSPELRTLRAFVDDLHELFQVRRTKKQAWRIWRRMRRTKAYLKIESLRKALEVLNKANMDKLLHYLDRDIRAMRGICAVPSPCDTIRARSYVKCPSCGLAAIMRKTAPIDAPRVTNTDT